MFSMLAGFNCFNLALYSFFSLESYQEEFCKDTDPLCPLRSENDLVQVPPTTFPCANITDVPYGSN